MLPHSRRRRTKHKKRRGSRSKRWQRGGVWTKQDTEHLSNFSRRIITEKGVVTFDGESIGISANGKIFMGTLTMLRPGGGDGIEIPIAVKLQPISEDAKNEGAASMQLSGMPGIPTYYCHGISGSFYYIIMQRLGITFGSSQRRPFLINELVGNYSIQLVNAIESLYNTGYYHIDITTSNILFGLGEESERLYLIDFCNLKRRPDEPELKFNIHSNKYLIEALLYIIGDYGIYGNLNPNEGDRKELYGRLKVSLHRFENAPPKFTEMRQMLLDPGVGLVSPLPENWDQVLVDNMPFYVFSLTTYIRTQRPYNKYDWFEQLTLDGHNNSFYVNSVYGQTAWIPPPPPPPHHTPPPLPPP